MFPLTICGVDDLPRHRGRGVTHVLSLLDPDGDVPETLRAFDPHRRATLLFHDVIEPAAGFVEPDGDHAERILTFGDACRRARVSRNAVHLLVHCHFGISRSTAAALILLAQARPEADADDLLEHLRDLRPQAWPNSRMVGFADDRLGRRGRLVAALGRFYARRLAAEPWLADTARRVGRGREVEMALRAV